ncbi:MAG: hypothetical protein WBL45_08000 [Solirubrobacterales bacterium]
MKLQSIRRRLRIPAGLAIAGLCLGLAIAEAPAEIIQRGELRVSFTGKINPTKLPRSGSAPIAVSLGARVTTIDRSTPPQLRRIEIAINRNGRFDFAGLPTCRIERIQPSSTADALRACGSAKVGEGRFGADVVIPEQSPFPSKGRLVAFNGTERGRPVILAHVFGTEPIPTSYTFPLRIEHDRDAFGTVLRANLPEVTARIAYVTQISLTLRRQFRHRGQTRSYLSASCPAPKGFPGAVFPMARARLDFTGGPTLTETLTRNCRVAG